MQDNLGHCHKLFNLLFQGDSNHIFLLHISSNPSYVPLIAFGATLVSDSIIYLFVNSGNKNKLTPYGRPSIRKSHKTADFFRTGGLNPIP